MSAKNFHRETVIEHDEPVTVRLSGGEQIIFWIEEDGGLSPNLQWRASELRLEPRARIGGPRNPFLPGRSAPGGRNGRGVDGHGARRVEVAGAPREGSQDAG